MPHNHSIPLLPIYSNIKFPTPALFKSILQRPFTKTLTSFLHFLPPQRSLPSPHAHRPLPLLATSLSLPLSTAVPRRDRSMEIFSSSSSSSSGRYCLGLAVFWVALVLSALYWRPGSTSPSAAAAPFGLRIFRGAPTGAAEFDLRDFGGVGNGVAVNTRAFELAVEAIRRRGGGRLNVGAGTWLTAPFNLTSHMTLFLAEGAVVLGLEDETKWPLMPPLPSYGYGREHKGPRYGSLIHGQHLKNVVITGHNGTIDGQGKAWWTKYRRRLLNYTRGPLVQIMWSEDIVISNITLQNSPFWTLHPYDCKNVTISGVTLLAPVLEAPNTDGIDPDSCENVLIENCYISVGDDGVAIKSGWDQYGIKYGRPSTNIVIRNLTVRSVVSAGVSIGSEMSGGVSNVLVENLHAWDSRRAVRIKTARGRGGYVSNITYRNLRFDRVRVGIVVTTTYNEHADEGFDPAALPRVENITFSGVRGRDVRVPVRIHGSEGIPIRGVTIRDMSVGIYLKKKHVFQCSYVEGRAVGPVSPEPCVNLDVYDEAGRLVKQSSSQNATDIDYDL